MPKDSNVIFLYGNDEFAMRRRLSEFGAMFADSTSADMNTARLEARTMSDDDLNTAVNSMPFLAKQRLILLSEPSARYANPSTRKKFFEFLEKVPSSAKLVMYEHVDVKTYRDKARQARDDERHWLVKWMKKAGLGLERFALPAPWQMTGWITENARQQGGEIESAAAARLSEMVGADTRQAAGEIAKLLTYVNWSRPITSADVEAVSIVTAEPDIFAMVDALASGDGRSAQKLLHRLMESSDPFGVWGMIVRQFRLLLQAREVIDARGGQREVESMLGVHAFVAEKVLGQAKRFTMGSLEAIYHRLLGIDEDVKRGQVSLDLALDMLVAELTR